VGHSSRPAPIRVLMVTPNFPPHRGGVETHTYELGRRLAAMGGFAIEVLTTDRSGELPPHEEMAGIRVERVPAWPRGADLYWSPAIRRRVRDATVDLVHCQGYHTFVPVLAMLAARQRRLPYLLTFHSGGHSSRLRHALRPVQVRLLRPLIRGARRLIAVSEFEAGLFRRALDLAAERLVTIPNGVDLPDVTAAAPSAREPGLILSIGRLERYKGHDRIIRALPLIRAHEPTARLMILGDGPYGRTLRDAAARAGVGDAVEITSVPRAELANLMQRAALVVLLSEYESQGLGAHEALAFGCRIMVSDSSALAELRGLPQVATVPRGADDRAVAEALRAQLAAGPIAADPHLRLPTWDECAQRLAAVYREVCASRT